MEKCISDEKFWVYNLIMSEITEISILSDIKYLALQLTLQYTKRVANFANWNAS